MKKPAFYRLITVIFISTLLTGCRFGNHADEAKPLKNSSIYKSVELFYTDPHQLESIVYLNSLSGPDSIKHENFNAPLSAIPQSISNAFTSLVYFAVPNDLTTHNPDIINSSQSADFATQIDAQGNPYYNSQDYDGPDGPPAYQLWANENCYYTRVITHQGNLDRSQADVIQNSDGSQTQVAGALQFTYSRSIRLYSVNATNNCDADLTFLANCYQTGIGCSQSAIDYSKVLFDVAVRAGTLNLNDVTHLKALEYIVHYQ